MRASHCGYGLAERTDNLGAMWSELVTASEKPDSKPYHSIHVLAGFLEAARKQEESFVPSALEATINNPKLSPIFPVLQGWIGVDADGVARVRKAVAKGALDASSLCGLEVRGIREVPPEPLASLLEEIGKLPGGVEAALDILHTYLFRPPDKPPETNERLMSIGRELLVRTDFQWERSLGNHSHFDYEVHMVYAQGGNRAMVDSGNLRKALLMDSSEKFDEARPRANGSQMA